MAKKSPDVFVIAFTLILIAAAATWILPGGAYQREKEIVGGATREVVVPGTYHVEPSKPQVTAIFLAPMRGFLRMGAIVGLIFIVGGAFNILNDTGAVAAGIHQLVKLLGGRSYLIIPIVMTVFSFFGGAYGMAEEAIPFALIFVPLALALGYDSIVGVCLSFVAAGVGFSAGFLNPFTVQISQAIAGVPLGSGIYYRIVVWIIATALAIVWVMIYAARVKANPTRSLMYDLDRQRREEIGKAEAEQVLLSSDLNYFILRTGHVTGIVSLEPNVSMTQQHDVTADAELPSNVLGFLLTGAALAGVTRRSQVTVRVDAHGLKLQDAVQTFGRLRTDAPAVAAEPQNLSFRRA